MRNQKLFISHTCTTKNPAKEVDTLIRKYGDMRGHWAQMKSFTVTDKIFPSYEAAEAYLAKATRAGKAIVVQYQETQEVPSKALLKAYLEIKQIGLKPGDLQHLDFYNATDEREIHKHNGYPVRFAFKHLRLLFKREFLDDVLKNIKNNLPTELPTGKTKWLAGGYIKG